MAYKSSELTNQPTVNHSVIRGLVTCRLMVCRMSSKIFQRGSRAFLYLCLHHIHISLLPERRIVNNLPVSFPPSKLLYAIDVEVFPSIDLPQILSLLFLIFNLYDLSPFHIQNMLILLLLLLLLYFY